MTPQFRKRLAGVLSEVRRLNDDAARFLSHDAASPALVHDVQLVLEEIATNVARHAAPQGEVTLDVTLALEPDGVHVQVEDDGEPFDPVSAPEPAAAESLARPWPGGYGLRIVKATAEALAWRREGNRNVLTLRVPDRG